MDGWTLSSNFRFELQCKCYLVESVKVVDGKKDTEAVDEDPDSVENVVAVGPLE